MFIKKIAGFILVTIVLNINNCIAQDTAQWTRGLRFGCDVSRFALSEFQQGRKAMEFSFDTEYKYNKFFTAEAGVEQISTSNDRLSYKSTGFYGRAGLDFNILKRDKLEKGRDIVYVGFRYGFYHVNHQVDSYVIPSYFPKDTRNGSFSSKNLNGHWIEVAFGLKVEVVKNLFLGGSARGRVLLFSGKDINYPNYMPGFGKGANKVNFGVNYSIYYQIPLMKVKPKKVAKIETKPKK